MGLTNYRIIMTDSKGNFETLRDILPDDGSPMGKKLNMLIIAKRPAPESVSMGHYFQGFKANNEGKRGGHGPMFWRQLRDHGILRVPEDHYDDDCLLGHGYGIMDIVKRPAVTGIEPTDTEYRMGMERITQAIKTHEPNILLFTYKPPLRQILKVVYRDQQELTYGFNHGLEKHFGAKVFLCPLPGVGGTTRQDIYMAMTNLADSIRATKDR